MADEKFLPCNTPYDQLGLLVEILRTLRFAAGLKPGEYDTSKGGLTIPDDLDGKKAQGKVKDEPKAEEPEPEKKAEKARDK